ncbi:MAG: succinate dehydrogenase assembly factor 4 [Rhodospirillaceae bacterium]|jgi:hypothetical protein
MTEKSKAPPIVQKTAQTESAAKQPGPGKEKPKESAKEIGGPKVAREIGGPKGPEPTRYGDWERKGRCIDF